ncbi:MAG: hypothetical protein ACYCUZ_06815 [Cuniculiplasma sp.]
MPSISCGLESSKVSAAGKGTFKVAFGMLILLFFAIFHYISDT